MNFIKSEQEKIDIFLISILYVMLTSIFFVTSIIQIQMSLFGHIFIKGIHFNLLICVMLFMYIVWYFINKRKLIFDKISIISVFLGIYVLLDMIFIKYRLDYSLGYIAYSINTELFIFLSCIILIAPPIIKRKDIKNISIYFLVVYVINIVISFMQHFSNSLLYKNYTDGNGNILLQTDEFTRSVVRAIGTFSSGLKLGIFCLFVVVFLLTYIWINYTKMNLKSKILISVLIILGIGVIYISYTRNLYFLLLYMIVYLLGFKFLRGKAKKVLIYMYPIVTPILYTLTTVLIIPVIFTNFASSLFSPQNLLARLNFWKHHFMSFKEWSLFDKLFGKSIVQISDTKAISYGVKEVVFDNMFLNAFSFIGIIGLVIFITYVFNIYLSVIRNVKENYLMLAMGIFSSGIFMMGTLNNIEDIFEILGVFIACLFIRLCNKVEEV